MWQPPAPPTLPTPVTASKACFRLFQAPGQGGAGTCLSKVSPGSVTPRDPGAAHGCALRRSVSVLRHFLSKSVTRPPGSPKTGRIWMSWITNVPIIPSATGFIKTPQLLASLRTYITIRIALTKPSDNN